MNLFSIIFNGGFALFFFNRLISEDYTDRKLVWYTDGIFFSMNLAAFMTTIF